MSNNKRTKFKSKDVSRVKKEARGNTKEYNQEMKNYLENKASNDASWYAANNQLLRDAASFSFNNPLGNRVPTYLDETSPDNYSIPGVCVFYLTPTVGVSNDGSSAVNIAARNIYSYVRHANSGHSNYNSPDLMMYILAMSNIYSGLAFMERIYGVMRTYSQVNRYLPKALLSAMKVDYDDIQNNLADFRYYINNFVTKVGSMCVPSEMSYIKRHIWMYSHVYRDGEPDKSSMYLYSPQTFYKFSAFTSQKGGELVSVPFGNGTGTNNYMTFKDMKNYFNPLLDAVIKDEDMNIMSGDILKAFGENGVVKISTIPEDFSIEPEYDEEVLMQMHNITIQPITSAPGSSPTFPSITQSDNIILYQPYFRLPVSGQLTPGFRAFVDFKHAGWIDPNMVMVGTRLTNVVPAMPATSPGVAVSTCGSEMCTNFRLISFSLINGVWQESVDGVTTYTNMPIALTGSTPHNTLHEIDRLTKFDWSPLIWYYTTNGEGAAQTLGHRYLVGDVSNYTTMGLSDLTKLHDTAILSEFSVPQMGAL